MKKIVTLALNSLEPSTWSMHEVDDVMEFLKTQFDSFPETARIYHNSVSKDNDITPSDAAEIEKLQSLEGHFYVIVYPAGPATIALYVIVGLLVVAAVTMKPKKPPVTMLKDQPATERSPNNQLSQRTNQVRINKRIPAIYGTVRSTPDSIGVTYHEFLNNQLVEYGLYCIGEGYYEITAEQVKEGTSPLTDLSGQSAQFYNPGTSPNLGLPFLQIGEVITNEAVVAYQSTGVDNTELVKRYQSGGVRLLETYNISVRKDGVFAWIKFNNIIAAKPSDDFYVGNRIRVGRETGSSYYAWRLWSQESGGSVVGSPVTLNDIAYPVDDFEILAINRPTATSIECKVNWNLTNPAVTGNRRYRPFETVTGEMKVRTQNYTPYGDFITMTNDKFKEVWINLFFPNGLYTAIGDDILTAVAAFDIRIDEVNDDGVPIGNLVNNQYWDKTLTISPTMTSKVFTEANANNFGITIKYVFGTPAKVRVRVMKAQSFDVAYNSDISDDTSFLSLFAFVPVVEDAFGDVTTVLTKTVANITNAANRDRRLNALVTRKLPQRISGSTFSVPLYPTNKASEIISAIALDPKIGNRTVDEIDFDSIYNAYAEVVTYFGTALAGEFSYTFDDENLSFEEIFRQVADSIFCTAYRQGNKLKLAFEKETEDSLLLFNHRNKLPRTEKRTITFGQNDYDGVSYEYVNPIDDSLETFYIPVDKSAVNPFEVEGVGVRSKLQAYFHAWREYNKILYQNTIVEFQATQEAELLVSRDRVLIADNTRPETQDGEVVSINVLELTLSQNVDLTVYPSYSIFLQHYDGTVENIAITATLVPNKVLLGAPPSLSLALDADYYARTTYIIVGNTEPRENAFLMTEKSSNDNLTTNITAVNYDARYYQNDDDYINGDVDINGNPIP